MEIWVTNWSMCCGYSLLYVLYADQKGGGGGGWIVKSEVGFKMKKQ